jgi:glycine cleavage system H protein
MVFVELPSEGDEASAEDEFCVVESVKAASGVYAPADLEVVEVNETEKSACGQSSLICVNSE